MADNAENLKRSPLEWIVEALEFECDRRDTNLLKDRLRKAKLRYSMADEGAIIYTEDRNLNKAQMEPGRTHIICNIWLSNGN